MINGTVIGLIDPTFQYFQLFKLYFNLTISSPDKSDPNEPDIFSMLPNIPGLPQMENIGHIRNMYMRNFGNMGRKEPETDGRESQELFYFDQDFQFDQDTAMLDGTAKPATFPEE